MAAMDVSAAQQVDVEFDQRLQDIGSAGDGISWLEFFGGYG